MSNMGAIMTAKVIEIVKNPPMPSVSSEVNVWLLEK